MAKEPVTLKTTQSELEALFTAEDRARSNSTTIKVPRDALLHVLMDHQALVAATIRPGGLGVREP